MADFIACVSPDYPNNWEICRSKGLWGVIEKRGSVTGRANAERVRPGDTMYVWIGRSKTGGPNGIKARARVATSFHRARGTSDIPWPDPDAYAGTFEIDQIEELPTPVSDRFRNNVSIRFGIENIALIHGFRELAQSTAEKLRKLFDEPERGRGRRSRSPSSDPLRR